MASHAMDGIGIDAIAIDGIAIDAKGAIGAIDGIAGGLADPGGNSLASSSFTADRLFG